MIKLNCALALLVFLNCSAAFALQNLNGQLQVSGGIAMPATSTAVFTNPAGLVDAPKALVLDAGAPEVWDNGTYRAGVQTGGSSYGVAAGVETVDRGQNNPLNAYYGAAVGNQAFTLGIAGRTGISNSDGTTLNAGLLFAAGSNAKIGVTAFGLNNGVDEWGAGVAFTVAPNVDLVIDAAASSSLSDLQAKPGIKVGSREAALTLSYGTGAREEFAQGFSAGGSFQFTPATSLEIQYNAGGELSKYFASLTLGF